MIKNKEGKYLRLFDEYFCLVENEFCEDIIEAAFFETKEYAEWKVFGTGLIDYTIVPITICEGDLEEENRVLKAKLENAERWNKKYDDLLEQFHNYKLKMFEYAQRLMALGKAFEPNVIEFLELTKEDVDRYINAQLDLIQQAKESEKDG